MSYCCGRNYVAGIILCALSFVIYGCGSMQNTEKIRPENAPKNYTHRIHVDTMNVTGAVCQVKIQLVPNSMKFCDAFNYTIKSTPSSILVCRGASMDVSCQKEGFKPLDLDIFPTNRVLGGKKLLLGALFGTLGNLYADASDDALKYDLPHDIRFPMEPKDGSSDEIKNKYLDTKKEYEKIKNEHIRISVPFDPNK